MLKFSEFVKMCYKAEPAMANPVIEIGPKSTFWGSLLIDPGFLCGDFLP